MRSVTLAAAALTWCASAHAQPAPEAGATSRFAPPRAVEERGVPVPYYRLSPHVVLPTIRLGFGARLRDAAPDRATLAFAFDALGGVVVRADRASPWGLVVDAGYGYAGFSQHLAMLGGGVMYGIAARADREGRPRAAGLRLGLLAHGLAGSSYDRVAAGARTGLVVGYTYYAIEVAHQALWVDGEVDHALHIVFTSLMPAGEEQ